MYGLVILFSILGSAIPFQLHSSQASKAELAKIATINLLEEQLIDAAANNQLEELQKLLKAGADINAKNKWGQTPLIMAARNGHVAIVEALIAANADLNIQANLSLEVKGQGRTALMTAASSPDKAQAKEHKQVILTLLNANADPYITLNQMPPQDFFYMLRKQYPRLFNDNEIQKKFADMHVPTDKRKPTVTGAPRNAPREIGNYSYSGHVIDQIEDRSIAQEDVEWLLENARAYKDPGRPDHLKLGGRNIGIITNKEKTKVVTAINIGSDAEIQRWLKNDKKMPIKTKKKSNSRCDAREWRSKK